MLDPADVEVITVGLDRLDAPSGDAPWTRGVLRLIVDRPGERAADLAASLGVDTPLFKRRVRRLKELGLTESLARGYRLSPRGRALLDRLHRQQPTGTVA